MRFLGFLTGVALLAILYVAITNSQMLSGNENKLANNIREMLNNGAEQEANKKNQEIDRPIQKHGPKFTKSSVLVEKQHINIPRKSVKPLPSNDKIIVMKSKVSSESVESETLAVTMKKPIRNDPSPQVVKVEKNAGRVKVLTSVKNASSEEKVQLQSFWGPFKTRISARGFAENLAKRTAIKLEVVETRPGAFMVAYPYVSEDDRLTIATLIEQITGLKLSDR